MDPTFRAPRGAGGIYVPPPDKSITHRALMLAAVASGPSLIGKALATGDCVSTRRCMSSLGVRSVDGKGGIEVSGVGLRGFTEPAQPLDAENSGTTTRLLAGLLAGQRFFAVLSGDESLVRRPMGRVVEPLRDMGARIEGRDSGRFAPLCFLPGDGSLKPVSLDLPVPSAQVKSCILLAALRATDVSRIGGKTGSRDHTERMLRALGVRLDQQESVLRCFPTEKLPGFEMEVPGDLSSASFFVAAALITGKPLTIHGCGINPTRCGFLDAARRMGVASEIAQESMQLGEPVGSISVHPASMKGVTVSPDEVPDLIDEIPLLAILGLFAHGRTEVRGASELRVKESDRLAMIASMVESVGGKIEIFQDGFAVDGPQKLRPGTVDPKGDHRIAMAAAVAGAGIPGGVTVTGFDCSRVSYPDFIRDFTAAGGEVA